MQCLHSCSLKNSRLAVICRSWICGNIFISMAENRVRRVLGTQVVNSWFPEECQQPQGVVVTAATDRLAAVPASRNQPLFSGHQQGLLFVDTNSVCYSQTPTASPARLFKTKVCPVKSLAFRVGIYARLFKVKILSSQKSRSSSWISCETF